MELNALEFDLFFNRPHFRKDLRNNFDMKIRLELYDELRDALWYGVQSQLKRNLVVDLEEDLK